MLVVDVNTRYGMQAGGNLDLSLPRLAQELDSHDIALAFTCSLGAVEYDHESGNRGTLQATERYPWLLPAATLDVRRYLDWEAEVERCLQAGVRLFRFFPELQRWSVSGTPFADLMARLAGSRVAVMLSGRGPDTPTAIAQATAEHGLPVILTDTFYDNMGEVIATARRHAHIYIETNYLSTPKAVDIMVREVGADRLLYGSAAPEYSVQRALNEVLEADITEGEKAAILGQNALRLFGLDPELATGRPRLTSAEMVRLPGPIIDVHCHLGRWRLPVPDGGATGLLALMRQAGVDRAIISSSQAIVYDISGGNRALADAIAGHPELLGYVVVNPNHLEQSCEELDRYYALPNFVGAKLHMYYSQDTTRSASGQALLREVAERGKPLKIHVEEDQAGALRALRELALTYPDWSIIKAHGGNGQSAEVVADVPNIYFEFGGSGGRAQDIRQALDVLGPRRVMFGSDADLCDIGKQIGVYYDVALAPEEREQVLFDNASRVFKL
ncbi:MAG: hypothetical protein CL878_10910 [Dehalococcoidia bacterium]|nr:hypothetical protein [Dehalococcoidia bacterium]